MKLSILSVLNQEELEKQPYLFVLNCLDLNVDYHVFYVFTALGVTAIEMHCHYYKENMNSLNLQLHVSRGKLNSSHTCL